MDIISKLPLNIIETIICFLPIQDAARTSILSKEWRYYWTKIPKLVFDECVFQSSTNQANLSVLERTFGKPSKRLEMNKRCKLFYAIYQVLLVHEGPIHEFTLRMEADDSCVEIDHYICHLLKKNTVKILKLDFGRNFELYELPASLFSLHQLTNMHLYNCAIFRECSFNKFACLTTLRLKRVQTYGKTLLRLLSGCPVLKRLTLHCSFADIFNTHCIPIVNLFECFLVLEYLSVSFPIFLAFELKKVPKELPTTLIHLKYLCVKDMCFNHKHGIPFLVLLIKCSPNVEKLNLKIDLVDWHEDDNVGFITIEESDITLDHLNDFEIHRFRNSESELDFVKLILAKSPVLKKVRIFPIREFDEEEESHLLDTLSCSSCASPLVEVIFPIREFDEEEESHLLDTFSCSPCASPLVEVKSSTFGFMHMWLDKLNG